MLPQIDARHDELTLDQIARVSIFLAVNAGGGTDAYLIKYRKNCEPLKKCMLHFITLSMPCFFDHVEHEHCVLYVFQNYMLFSRVDTGPTGKQPHMHR